MSRRGAWAAVVVGGILVALPLWLRWGSWVLGSALTSRAPAPLVSEQVPTRFVSKYTPAPVQNSNEFGAGDLLGTLDIPRLGLKTAFRQGTGDVVLLQTPGHFMGSVLPGQVGTSLIAAHNVTFFRHLDRLVPGDEVKITTAQGVFWFRVTGSAVVSDQATVVNTLEPSVDLVACYPLNALYFTPDRYVVHAVMVKDALAQEKGAVAALPPPVATYRAAMDPAIAAYAPLALRYNSVPMGKLTYHTPPTKAALAFERSPKPLLVEESAITLWDAARYAGQAGRRSWWNSLFAQSAPPSPNPYWRARSITFSGPLDVILAVDAGGRPTDIRLFDSRVVVDGRPWSAAMTIAIRGQTLSIAQMAFRPVP